MGGAVRNRHNKDAEKAPKWPIFHQISIKQCIILTEYKKKGNEIHEKNEHEKQKPSTRTYVKTEKKKKVLWGRGDVRRYAGLFSVQPWSITPWNEAEIVTRTESGATPCWEISGASVKQPCFQHDDVVQMKCILLHPLTDWLAPSHATIRLLYPQIFSVAVIFSIFQRELNVSRVMKRLQRGSFGFLHRNRG